MIEKTETGTVVTVGWGGGDAAHGRHSNIPRCCIRYFIEVWSRADDSYIDSRTDLMEEKFPAAFWCGYIPCDGCLVAGSFRKIHRCGLRCLYGPGFEPERPKNSDAGNYGDRVAKISAEREDLFPLDESL